MSRHIAIPTTYKGLQLRSRLEAKWACFFDKLEWPWSYEPFDLDGWTPDFLIAPPFLQGYQTLVEVKPLGVQWWGNMPEPPDEAPKIRAEIDRARTPDCPYFAMIVGINPKIAYFRGAGGWRFAGGALYGEPPYLSDDWKRIWKKACNKSQWKSPKGEQ